MQFQLIVIQSSTQQCLNEASSFLYACCTSRKLLKVCFWQYLQSLPSTLQYKHFLMRQSILVLVSQIMPEKLLFWIHILKILYFAILGACNFELFLFHVSVISISHPMLVNVGQILRLYRLGFLELNTMFLRTMHTEQAFLGQRIIVFKLRETAFGSTKSARMVVYFVSHW